MEINGNKLFQMLEEKLSDLDQIMAEIDMDNVVGREIMNIDRLSRYCKISLNRLHELKKQKKIPFYQVKDNIYFYKDDIDNWMKTKEYKQIRREASRLVS